MPILRRTGAGEKKNSGCACDTFLITLSGGAYTSHSSKAGEYIKLEGTVMNGRPVYQHRDGSSKYLYFWAAAFDWRLGSDYNTENNWFHSQDNIDAPCPESAGSWRHQDRAVGLGWIDTNASEMSIACSPLTAMSPHLKFPNT